MTTLTDVMDRLLLSTAEGYWLVDNQGVTLDLNPAMARILNVPKNEVIGRSVMEFVNEDNARIFENQLKDRAGGLSSTYQAEIRSSDGTMVPCVANACPVHDAAGNQIGSIGLWTDITEIKTAQQQLLRAKNDAEEANQAKSAFLASVSHELRTPLNAILGFAQLLCSDNSSTLTDRQDRHLGQILKAGDHLMSLVDQLLDLARIESGSLSIELEAVSTHDLLEDAAEMIKPLAADSNITLEFGPRTEAHVFLDRIRTREILLNLLSNAIKYNHEHGTVNIRATRESNGNIRFSVADNGPGIPQDRHQEVFTAFNRLGMEWTRIQGTGIGLLVTKGLTETMGGTIGFTSAPGEGSTFWVEFPEHRKHTSAPEESADSVLSTAQAAVPSLTGVVLYVDDDKASIAMMEEMLSQHEDVSLVSVSDGATSLEFIDTLEPDLILLDAHSATMTGCRLAEAVKHRGQSRKIPIVAMTSETPEHEQEHGRMVDFDGYLSKPVKVNQIIEVMSRYLARPQATAAPTNEYLADAKARQQWMTSRIRHV